MGKEVEVSKDTIIYWQQFLENLIHFLDYYRLLVDSYISDFFTQDLWCLVNLKWASSLEGMNFAELSNFANISTELKLGKMLPLSLLAYRASCSSFILPRNAQDDDSSFRDYFDKSKNSTFDIAKTVFHKWEESKSVISTSKQTDVHHIFRVHLKPKKQHEVTRLSHIASLAVECTSAKAIIDVGSGQGHLARRMAYFHRIPSVCIETEEDLLQGAKKFDHQVERHFVKLAKVDQELVSPMGPKHHRCHISQDLSKEQLSSIFKDVFPSLNPGECIQFGLVGLHTCGDLGPTLIKTFCSVPDCVSLLSVGCCYMKLSTSDAKSGQNCGYPMSSYISSKDRHWLSYNAKEIACHAIESYCNKLRLGADDLKVHCYRSVLEQIILKKCPHLTHSGLKPVKNAHLLSFPDYASRTLLRLQTTENIFFDMEEFDSPVVSKNLTRWKQVVIFYSIRLMLAPAVETLILLDRMMFLYEKGHIAMLAPLFDPKLSPRNFVLLAVKHGSL